MSREQIEEMAKEICHVLHCESKKTNEPCYKYCKAYIYAFRAYNAGYRKQSEGEWETVGDDDEELIFRCSCCSEEYSCELDMRLFAKYCPNCGAKMKGEKTDA